VPPRTPVPAEVTPVRGAGVLRQVPVEPDAPTARRWAEAELSQPVYHERPNLLQMAIDWVLEQLQRTEVALTTVDPRTAAAIISVLVLVAVGIALLVAGPVRRAGRRSRASVDVFGDDRRSAAELRASADALAAAGQWSTAVLDRFRALLRSLEDRALLDERPGRTADEAAAEAGRLLPSCAGDLDRASRLFDDVCYGDVAATADDDAWLRELDQRLTATRPADAGSAPAEMVAR
jgi:hypothetical protein